MSITMAKKYGVVQFRGTLRHNTDHQLVFESDDPVAAMTELERLCDDVPEESGFMLVIKGVHDQGLA